MITLPPTDVDCARLNAEELTDLFHFMNASLTATTPHALVTLALGTVQQQTQAPVCGFLSFEAEDCDLKVVLPVGASVNGHLSRQLTQKVRQEGLSAWLGAPHGDDEELESGSLAAYLDAVCVPLRRSPVAEPGASRPEPDEPLGALHAYQTTRCFTEREVRFCEILAGCLAKALHVHRSRRALEADNTRLREHGGHGGNELIGSSPTMRRLRSQAASLAASAVATVLIEGESGVGKELVALGLHSLSLRHEGPLVTVNCAALSTTVAEAELFGYEKGAFTGADRARPGLFQQADEGTLFLDEIGDLSPDSQARLLRVLETKRVRPLMARSEITVDVRILAATNRDLEKDVKVGRFRRDLFFRLGARLRVPPLRDHPEDVPALAAHFLAKVNQEYRRHVRLSPEAVDRLQAYCWPGNVRQLRSVLETAVAMAHTDVLRPADLRLGVESRRTRAETAERFNLEELEADHPRGADADRRRPRCRRPNCSAFTAQTPDQQDEEVRHPSADRRRGNPLVGAAVRWHALPKRASGSRLSKRGTCGLTLSLRACHPKSAFANFYANSGFPPVSA